MKGQKGGCLEETPAGWTQAVLGTLFLGIRLPGNELKDFLFVLIF